MFPRPRSLPHPVRSWRGLGSAGKYLLYSRWSLDAAVLFMPLVFLIPAVTRVGLSGWGVAVMLLLMAGASALAVGALELQPTLNLQPRAGYRRWFGTALVVHVVGLAVCLSLSALPALPVSDDVEAVALFLSLGLGFTLSLALLPFVPFRWWWVAGLAVLLAVLLHERVGGTLSNIFFLVGMPPFLTLTTVLTVWTAGLMLESERARRLEAELQVSEERLRFAQELHDTLGQRLAAMSIKTQLAQKFAEREDPRLHEELRDLHELTGTATREMREVVRGYRGINLATEVEGARALLLDAGLTLTVSGSSLDVPGDMREPAAWFVRETATNIIRHARPTRVELVLAPDRVEMRNDGAHGGVDKLGGLETLRRRVARQAAQLLLEHDGEEFTAALVWREEP